MLDPYMALLVAIVRQAALDYHQRQAQDAGAFLTAAGLLDQAAIICQAAHQPQSVTGRLDRRPSNIVQS